MRIKMKSFIDKWLLSYRYKRLIASKEEDDLFLLYNYIPLLRSCSLDRVNYKDRANNPFVTNFKTAGDFIAFTYVINGYIKSGSTNIHQLTKGEGSLMKTNLDQWLLIKNGEIDEKQFVEKVLPTISELVDTLIGYRECDDSTYIYYKLALDQYIKLVITIFDTLVRIELGDNNVSRHIWRSSN